MHAKGLESHKAELRAQEREDIFVIKREETAAEAEAKIAVAREVSGLKLEEMAKKYEYDYSLKELEVTGQENRLRISESRKDRRQDNNNNDKSALQEQKAKGLGRQNFTKIHN